MNPSALDLIRAGALVVANHHPDFLDDYEELEHRTGYTMHMSRVPIRVLATQE